MWRAPIIHNIFVFKGKRVWEAGATITFDIYQIYIRDLNKKEYVYKLIYLILMFVVSAARTG